MNAHTTTAEREALLAPTRHTQITAHADGGLTIGPNRAQRIIADVAAGVAHIDEPRERLARQVGALQAYIRMLCSECDDLAQELADVEPQS